MPKPQRKSSAPRRICFVTGTRAEFGLMQSTLAVIRDDPNLELQLIATGMHTHASRGRTVDEIRRGGWKLDAVVEWPEGEVPTAIARSTGQAIAALADVYIRLAPDVVLVVGDRVEAFAAASAAAIAGIAVAHVHGGDRAQGQADDSLRHAISKLAHIHFAATDASGDRLFAMGEDRWRIHTVGAPGVDGIRADAMRTSELRELGIDHPRDQFVLFVQHPTDADAVVEERRTRTVLSGLRKSWDGPIVALFPNSDAGAAGIVKALTDEAAAGQVELYRHLGRRAFLGLLRDCIALVGNSSAGIIEAGSFGTRVLDVGPRQAGREHGPNVIHVRDNAAAVAHAFGRAVDRPRVSRATHPYDRGGAGTRIGRILRALPINDRLRRKLIRY